MLLLCEELLGWFQFGQAGSVPFAIDGPAPCSPPLDAQGARHAEAAAAISYMQTRRARTEQRRATPKSVPLYLALARDAIIRYR